MVIFTNNTVLRWVDHSKIVSVSWCHGRMFLGNNLGQLYAFKAPSLTNPVDTDEKLKITVSKNSIVYISSLEPRDELLALDTEGDLYIVNISFKVKPVILSKKVLCFTRQAVESYEDVRNSEKILPVTYMANICVGLKQKIQIYFAIGESIVHQRDIAITDNPVTISWLNKAIVFGSTTAYSMIRPDGTGLTELCRNDLTLEKRLVMESKQRGIITCTCLDDDVLVVCDNIGVFYNGETMNLSNKNTIQWSGAIESLGTCPPFIVGLTSKKKLEIHGIRDQLLYKTLDLTTSATTYFMPDKCKFLCATSSVVTSVQPSSYYENISNFLENDKITEALQLVNLYFSQKDTRRLSEISTCHTIAGWIYFAKLNFPYAFLHFTHGKVDIVHLLSFWEHYYPLEVPEWYEVNREIPKFFRHMIPEKTQINKFIENALNDPEFVKFNQIVKSKKELLEQANGSLAIFLSKKPKWSCSSEGKEEDEESLKKKLETSVETLMFLLFSECNDSRYNIILRKDKNNSLVDVEATKNHLIEMNKSDVYAKLLIRDGRLMEAMEVLSDLVTSRNVHSYHSQPEEESSSPCLELASCINMVLDSEGNKTNQGSNFSQEEIKQMLNTYLPLLFENSPSSALHVLTKNHTTLPLTSDEILSMINEHSKKMSHGNQEMTELQINYLEDLVLKNKSGGVHENTMLAKYYIDSISQTLNNFNLDSKKGMESKNKKQTLFELLEGNYTFDFDKIDEMIRNLDMPEAKIILYSKLGKHYQALETIYTKWNKDRIQLCEAYCQCFCDIKSYEQLNKDNPYKRLFTHYEYWIKKAEEWPLEEPNLYVIDKESETSIDKLIMMLLKIIVNHTNEKENNATIAKHLLSKYIHFCGHNSTLNGISILEVIPGDWNFNEFADFFNHLQLRFLHEQRTKSVKRGLTRSLHLKTSLSLHKLTSMPPVKIDTNTLCMVCSEPIKIGTSIAIKVPTQKEGAETTNLTKQPLVVHEYCIRKGHIS